MDKKFRPYWDAEGGRMSKEALEKKYKKFGGDIQFSGKICKYCGAGGVIIRGINNFKGDMYCDECLRTNRHINFP